MQNAEVARGLFDEDADGVHGSTPDIHHTTGVTHCTLAGARTICDHAREKFKTSSSARTIIKFNGDVQIAEILRCQFYL